MLRKTLFTAAAILALAIVPGAMAQPANWHVPASQWIGGCVNQLQDPQTVGECQASCRR